MFRLSPLASPSPPLFIITEWDEENRRKERKLQCNNWHFCSLIYLCIRSSFLIDRLYLINITELAKHCVTACQTLWKTRRSLRPFAARKECRDGWHCSWRTWLRASLPLILMANPCHLPHREVPVRSLFLSKGVPTPRQHRPTGMQTHNYCTLLCVVVPYECEIIILIYHHTTKIRSKWRGQSEYESEK